MIGAIAGDMIGSVYEQFPIKKTDFPLFKSGSHFTDDTVLTIAVADAILSGEDYSASLRKWARRYPLAGYGTWKADFLQFVVNHISDADYTGAAAEYAAGDYDSPQQLQTDYDNLYRIFLASDDLSQSLGVSADSMEIISTQMQIDLNTSQVLTSFNFSLNGTDYNAVINDLGELVKDPLELIP